MYIGLIVLDNVDCESLNECSIIVKVQASELLSGHGWHAQGSIQMFAVVINKLVKWFINEYVILWNVMCMLG